MQDIQTVISEIHAEITKTPLTGHHYSDFLADEIQDAWFAIAIVKADGTTYETGDSRQNFALQSMSKVFTYGAALEHHGREAVLERIGVEPTGRRYNAVLLEENTGRPYNPMVNAGAIAIADMMNASSLTNRSNHIVHTISRYVGRHLQLDAETYTYELQAGDHNRAIAHLMRSSGALIGKIDEALNIYFQQCSLFVNTVELATMAATLANNGVHPITGERALKKQYVRDVLSVMYTCGMYDASGEWAYKVGLPAKSGVSGGIFAVVPGKMGIAVFSPLLDKTGHSIRGIKSFVQLSEKLDLHIFNPALQAASHDAPDDASDTSRATTPDD